jgi:hypothetical protein
MAWLQTYDLPHARRTRASQLQLRLWRRGINRSTIGPVQLSGLTRLAAAWRDARDASEAELLRSIASMDAFEVLIGPASESDLAWEAIALHDAVDGPGSSNIRTLAENAELAKLAEAAAVAAWLHGLTGDTSDHPRPPSSRLTAITLALPELRGLRRRGARRHGERIGRFIAEATRNLSLGSKRVLDVDLPPCLAVDEPLRRLAAPLAQDLLSRAAAACSAKPDLDLKVRLIAECCPRLIDAAKTLHDFEGSHARPCEASRHHWLKSLLGLATLEEQQAVDQDAYRSSLNDGLEIPK